MPTSSQVNVYNVINNSGVAVARRGVLNTVNLNPGSANVTATLFDNASAASGTILAVVTATTTGTGSNSLVVSNLPFLNGIYVSFTAGSGTNATCSVYVE